MGTVALKNNNKMPTTPRGRFIAWLLLTCCGCAIQIAGIVIANNYKLPAFVIYHSIVTPRTTIIAVFFTGGIAWILGLIMAMTETDVLPRRLMVIMTLVLAIPLSLYCALMGLLISLNTGNFHVLSPDSPDGCRIVVETTVMLNTDSYGNIYLAAPRSLILHPVGQAWDGYAWIGDSNDPIVNHDWSLTWEGERGVLRVAGTGTTILCPQ